MIQNIPYSFNRMAVYAGTGEPPVPVMDDSFTLKAVNDSVTVSIEKNGSPFYDVDLYYRKNYIGNYQPYTVGSPINLRADETVSFSGTNYFFSSTSNDYYSINTAGNGNVIASGEARSLINNSDDISNYDYIFTKLFYNNTKLIDASQLVLPSSNFSKRCFRNMFYHCQNMTDAPALPATSLASGCYEYMFYHCYGLRNFQEELPASSLPNQCYGNMFTWCTSLSTAPILSAVVNYGWQCFRNMFDSSAITGIVCPKEIPNAWQACKEMFIYCYNLQQIVVGWADWPNWDAYQATLNWVQNVGSVGTFICPSTLSNGIGTSQIPYDWTVDNNYEQYYGI